MIHHYCYWEAEVVEVCLQRERERDQPSSAGAEEVTDVDLPVLIGGGLVGNGEGATRRFLAC